MKKIVFLFLMLPLLSIAQDNKKENGNVLNGIASIYAKHFDGAKTATGEIFKHSNLTAASNNFKVNTLVRVTNLLNNKSVIVRINDRMHPRMAAKGRVVDLTSTAANLIGFGLAGLLKVKVEILDKVSK
ncbi:MAG: rare lipoprotein precursor [Segetibacter sp.]|nr:rare lipoprotein precursor [Segetibacter sp.]